MAVQTDPNLSGGAPPSNGAWPSAWPRYLNALIAAWLFISAFAWSHTMPLRQDTWIVGVLMFISALIAIGTPGFRWVNTVLAVWLFFSTLAFPHHVGGTLWNNLIVAVVVFLLSLIPSVRPRIGNVPVHRAT